MATLIENLKTRRDAIGVELAALSATKAGGLPNVSGDGGGVNHSLYKMDLYRELEMINKQISAVEPAFEVTGEARG